MFNVSDYNHHDTSETLTTANQSEDPNKQCNSGPCFSTIETKSGYFMIPFTVTDIKNILLRTTLSEKYKRKSNIRKFTTNSNYSFNGQPITASFTILIEKKFAFFLLIHQKIS